MPDLEQQFHSAMISIYESAKDDCNYNATRFLSMIAEKGGLATARTLLAKNDPSDGFTALWECGRLDLTVEAFVLKPEFASLFSEGERRTAEERLREYGYKFGK